MIGIILLKGPQSVTKYCPSSSSIGSFLFQTFQLNQRWERVTSITITKGKTADRRERSSDQPAPTLLLFACYPSFSNPFPLFPVQLICTRLGVLPARLIISFRIFSFFSCFPLYCELCAHFQPSLPRQVRPFLRIPILHKVLSETSIIRCSCLGYFFHTRALPFSIKILVNSHFYLTETTPPVHFATLFVHATRSLRHINF